MKQKVKVKVKLLSRVRLFATTWTVARQAPLSMGFSRQEYWSGLPFPSPEDLPDPGIEPKSPSLQADSLPVSHRGSLRITIWSNNSTPEYMLQRIWSRHSNRYLYILFVPFIVALYTAKRWKQCNKSVIHIYIERDRYRYIKFSIRKKWNSETC